MSGRVCMPCEVAGTDLGRFLRLLALPMAVVVTAVTTTPCRVAEIPGQAGPEPPTPRCLVTEPTPPDALYTKVVKLDGQWYREIYIGSAYLWRFVDMIKLDEQQAALEREA